MYRVERAQRNIVQLGLGDEVISIRIGGLAVWKKYIQAQERLLDIQKKLEAYGKEEKEAPVELMTLLGDTIVYIFQLLFGEDNTKKIVEFFEGEYDEMFSALLPFITKELIPKIRETAKNDSEQMAKRIAGDVPSES